MDYNISTHKKNDVYEIRTAVSVSKGITDAEAKDQLNELHTKLDKAIPGAYRPKFNIMRRDMILTIRAKEYNQAQGQVSELKQYLDDAIRKMNAQTQQAKMRDLYS